MYFSSKLEVFKCFYFREGIVSCKVSRPVMPKMVPISLRMAKIAKTIKRPIKA